MGEILGLYGVQGGLRLFSYLEHPPDLLGYARLWLALPEGPEPRRLTAGHQQGQRLIGYLEGVDDREAARELLGTRLLVPREALEELGEDEYLWADLVGLEVWNRDGAFLGQVTALMETGANDVLIVRDGRRERLIPFLAEAVLGVYPDRGILRTDWDPDF